MADRDNVTGIADLGIVFLLFLIGLELSYSRLVAMRRLVLGLGGLQVALSTIVLSFVGVLAGLSPPQAMIVGASLALSSTAIVLEVLTQEQRLNTTTGRASFSVLLAQDIAVVPLLLFVSIVAVRSDASVMASAAIALGQAGLALAAIVVVGRLLLRPLFRLVVSARSTELFIGAILFVIVAAGVVAAQAGMSMALGAFVAGLLLAETEYRKAIEATVEPFKGLLLGIFFFTVGMAIDVREMLREPLALIAAVAGLVAVKAALVTVLARLFGLSWAAAVETGLLLGPGGEFAFVAIGLAAAQGILGASTASFILAATSLGMAAIPLMSAAGKWVARYLASRRAPDPDLLVRPAPDRKQAILVGYGRVGQMVGKLLEQHQIAYVATDDNTAAVLRGRKAGKPVFYGNATDEAFLRSCGIDQATSVVITIHDREGIDRVVALVRRLRPDLLIVSRARDAEHARHLYRTGVSDAVPETIEASLQLSEATLVGLGVPAGPVIASIHEERDVVRRSLRDAAASVGRDGGALGCDSPPARGAETEFSPDISWGVHATHGTSWSAHCETA